VRWSLLILAIGCGSTAPGGAGGGSTAGGSTAGGSTAGGGATAGGSSAGGSTAGGSTAGGGATAGGGSTAGGGATAGGATAGGSAFPAPAPEGCVQNVTAGQRDYTCDGIRYRATIPAQCLTRACGLIFDVHGFSMTAEQQEANSRLAARAPARDFIVVQPSAPGVVPFWTPSTDDPKVFAAVELFARVFHTDPKRLHFTGFSQGGAMTWRMLCAHADAWASVAPAAEQGCPFTGTNRPSREVPTLFLFGTLDGIVSFNLAATPQRNAVVTGWGMSSGAVVAADAGYTRTRHVSDAGTPFEFVQHDYTGSCAIANLGGHCFPGSTDPGGLPGQACSYRCNPPNGFDWGAEVLDWFVAHPKP